MNKALLIAGNYAEARLAMDHINEEVAYIPEGRVSSFEEVEKHTNLYMYGTFRKRLDLAEVTDFIARRFLVPRDVIVKDGHWRGEL